MPMMGLEIAKELEEDREHLQQIIVQCSERCLYQSAKWSAELLNSALDIPGVDDEESGDDSDLEMTNSQAELARRNRRNWHPIPAAISAISSNPRESVLETREYSRYLLAKSFFDCREYDRCSAVFLPELVGRGPPEAGIMLPPSSSTTTSPRKGKTRDSSLGNHLHQTRPVTRPKRRKRLSQKALFLALYAKYMSGEKRKDEDMEMILGPNDTGSATNPELHQVEQQLRRWREDDAASDGTIPHSEGWLEYLHGVVLAKLKNEDEAKTLLLNSIHIQPYNWGAWHELSTLMHSTEVVRSPPINQPPSSPETTH